MKVKSRRKDEVCNSPIPFSRKNTKEHIHFQVFVLLLMCELKRKKNIKGCITYQVL